MNRILVIKLAALGDFVQAIGPMRRIREAHPHAQLTLLTTPPYVELAQATGVFDAIDGGGRPRGVADHLALIGRLRRGRFERVYDLQTSRRSSRYRRAFWPRAPQWSGIAPGASHRHAEPQRDAMHTLERQADQLRHAGVWPDAPTASGTAPPPDLRLLVERLAPELGPLGFGLTGPYALLVPGASPLRPGKRWPVAAYAELAQVLSLAGLTPVVIGGPAEVELAVEIVQAAGGVNLAGRTGFAQIAALGAGAAVAIGNDTGPMHLIAAGGAPCVALFSGASDPALCAPRGLGVVRVLRTDSLADLPVEEVVQAAAEIARFALESHDHRRF